MMSWKADWQWREKIGKEGNCARKRTSFRSGEPISRLLCGEFQKLDEEKLKKKNEIRVLSASNNALFGRGYTWISKVILG